MDIWEKIARCQTAGEVQRMCRGTSWTLIEDAEIKRLRQTVIDGEQRCIELLQERDRLRAALEPFGDLDGEGAEDFSDETPVLLRFGRSTVHGLKLGDLRRARAALSVCEAKE